MDIRKTLKEVCILILISSFIALTVNSISPNGIALFGQWDTSKGVISANEKNNMVDYQIEIDNITDAKKIYDSKKAIFVDARAYEEFQEGHIKGAASLPINSFDEIIERFLGKYPLSAYLITYCSGRECEDSHNLAQLLSEAGYGNISVFIDGYPLWVEHGYPVE